MTNLYLFQIGPVQAFIAQARRTQDLYVGSRILSQLASAGVYTARDFSSGTFQPIFPVFMNEDEKRLPNSVAHKFAFIQTGNPHDVAAKVQKAIEEKWKNHYAELVSKLIEDATKRDDWKESYTKQIENWLEIFWVAVPLADNKSDYTLQFAAANRALAARKLTRTFPQVYQPGRKCTLTGMQSALFTDDKVLDQLRKKVKDHPQEPRIIRHNEYMGAIALIKRLAQFTVCELGRDEDGNPVDVERFAATNDIAGIPDREADTTKRRDGKRQEGYFAVLHMDGDRMGKLLSQLDSQEEHQQFSKKLAEFAQDEVPKIIGQFDAELKQEKRGRAQLVYAGGDDVLVLLPIHRVLDCAYEIQKKYVETLIEYEYVEEAKDGKQITKTPTMSAGIAITPYDLPLDNALELAREAESTAKEQYGRNAVVVVEAHGTGMQRPAGANWDVIPLFNSLIDLFHGQSLSGKLGYDLQALAHDMVGENVPPEARQAEARRLFKRRMAENLTDEQKSYMANISIAFAKYGEQLGWDDMANWVILARFLGQSHRNEQGI